MVDGAKTRSNTIELEVETLVTRDSKGRRVVTPLRTSAEALKAQAQVWLAESKKMTDSELAKALGVSERHAIDDAGPLSVRLNTIAEDLRQRESTRTEDLAVQVKIRDGIQERIRRLIDLAESGDAPSKGVSVRLRENERELAAVELKVAELEGLASAAAMDTASINLVIEDTRRGVADLPDRPDDEKQRVLKGLLAEVRLGYGSPIKLVFWLDEMVAKMESLRTQETTKPTPTEVSLGGRGFVWRSSMVEAPGIEINRYL